MKKPKILISAPYFIEEIDNVVRDHNYTYRFLLETLLGFDIIIPDVEERLSERQLIDLFTLESIEYAIVGDDNFTEKVYKLAQPKLKLVIKWGTGIDSLNKSIAKFYGVDVYNTPSAFTIPVSESTIGFMLSHLRKIDFSNRKMEKGSWCKVTGKTLNESKVGIIGMGNIGTEVANKLMIFGTEISFYDPNVNNYKINRVNDLGELLRDNDVITIHCDLNESSHHLIGYDELLLLENKVLINTARGSIINNDDLIRFLDEGRTIYVGMDVFEEEPLDKNSIFRKSENFIISSHNTNNSPTFWENVHLNCVRMLKEYINFKYE